MIAASWADRTIRMTVLQKLPLALRCLLFLVISSAVCVIQSLGDERDLVPLLTHTNAAVRLEGVRRAELRFVHPHLPLIRPGKFSDSEPALPLEVPPPASLMQALARILTSDPEPRVRIASVDTLYAMRYRTNTWPWISAMLSSKDPAVSYSALRLVAWASDTKDESAALEMSRLECLMRAQEVFRTILTSGADDQTLIKVLEDVKTMGPYAKGCMEAVRQLTKADRPKIRKQARQTLKALSAH